MAGNCEKLFTNEKRHFNGREKAKISIQKLETKWRMKRRVKIWILNISSSPCFGRRRGALEIFRFRLLLAENKPKVKKWAPKKRTKEKEGEGCKILLCKGLPLFAKKLIKYSAESEERTTEVEDDDYDEGESLNTEHNTKQTAVSSKV